MPLNRNSSILRFAAVVPAAGASRRMGRPKMLLPVGGEPLIAHVVRTCAEIEFISSIVVVTGYLPHQIAAVLNAFDIRLIHNPHYDAGGMISSVKVGVAAIAGKADAIFIALGDQPGILPETFAALRDAWARSAALLVRPTLQARHGHPILVSARGAREILQLPRNSTLKDFVNRFPSDSIDVPVDDPAILLDVDTPADYQRAIETLAQPTGV